MGLLRRAGGPSALAPLIAVVTFALSLAIIPLVGAPTAVVAFSLLLALTTCAQAGLLALARAALGRCELPVAARGATAVVVYAVIGASGTAAFGWLARGEGASDVIVTDWRILLVDGAAGWVLVGVLVTVALDRRLELEAAIAHARRSTARERRRGISLAELNDAEQVLSDLERDIVPPLEEFLACTEGTEADRALWAGRLRAMAQGPVRAAAHALHPLTTPPAETGDDLPEEAVAPWWRGPVLRPGIPTGWITLSVLPGCAAFLLVGATPWLLALAVLVTVAGGLGLRRLAVLCQHLPAPQQWLITTSVLLPTGAVAGALSGAALGLHVLGLAVTDAALVTAVGVVACVTHAWQDHAARTRTQAARDYLTTHGEASARTRRGIARKAQAAQVLHSLVQSRLLAAAGELDDQPWTRAHRPVEAVLRTDLPAVAGILRGEGVQEPAWPVGLDLDNVTTVGLDRVPVAMQPVVGALAEEAVHNARRHGHAQRISLECRAEDSALGMWVRDDGSGFPERPQASLGFLLYDAACISWDYQRGADGGAVLHLRLPLVSEALPDSEAQGLARIDL